MTNPDTRVVAPPSPDDHDAILDAIAETLPTPEARRGVPGHDAAARLAARAHLIRLRLQGLSYDAIAEQVGYADGSGVRHVVVAALNSVIVEDVRHLRHVENLRYDRAAAALWPKVLEGNPRSVDSWLRVSEARRRLNGMDAPVQVQISAGVAAELQDALAEVYTLVTGRDDPPPLELAAGSG